MEKLYELALFAGAGGGLLATRHLLGWRTVCYVERDTYCVNVLKARIGDGLLDDAPIWSDVRSFTKRNNQCRRFIRELRKVRGSLVVTAGFPCQPFSQAGKQLGTLDERNMWPDTIRIIREIRTRWVLLENVPRLLSLDYIRRIFGDLAASGYDCRWDCIPASAIGAYHQRDRLWVVATERSAIFPDPNSRGQQEPTYQHQSEISLQSGADIVGCSQDVSDADSGNGNRGSSTVQVGRQWGQGEITQDGTIRRIEWGIEPGLGRVADGVANRVDRLRAIGQGQVPAVVAAVWGALI